MAGRWRPTGAVEPRWSVGLVAILTVALLVAPIGADAGAAPSLPSPPADTGAVRDGGFEASGRTGGGGDAFWRLEGEGVRFSGERPYRGRYGARLCGEAGCVAGIAQEVPAPGPGEGALLLVFQVRVETAKTSGLGCQDDLLIEVAVGAGAPEVVGRLCEEVAGGGFARQRLDVTGFARRAAERDQPLVIALVGRTDGAAASTTFWVDDVALLREGAPPGPANVRVSAGDFAAYSEPHLAVDPTDPDRLLGAAKRFTDNARYRFRVGTFVSEDGGRRWVEGGELAGVDGYEVTSDPVVAFGPDGMAYLVVVAVPALGNLDERPWGILLFRSVDGGRRFEAPVTIDREVQNDKPWLAVDRSRGSARGSVYVGWARQCVTYLSRSTDGGRTFAPARRLLEGCAGVQIVVGPDGTLFVLAPVYGRGRRDEFAFALTVSRDGGASFEEARPVIRAVSMPVTLAGDIRPAGLPQLAVAPDSGVLVVAWNDPRGGTTDVWLSRSIDGGATFSAPRRVHAEAANDQFQPAVAAGSGGTVVVSWFDRRRDAANRLAELVVARSVDGGVSFGPGVRVSTQRFDPALAAPIDLNGNRFFGDYQGLVLTGEVAIPLWNDARRGLQQLYAVRLPLATLAGSGTAVESVEVMIGRDGRMVGVPSRATTPKWRRSRVGTRPPRRSAQAMTAASTKPRGRSASRWTRWRIRGPSCSPQSKAYPPRWIANKSASSAAGGSRSSIGYAASPRMPTGMT